MKHEEKKIWDTLVCTSHIIKLLECWSNVDVSIRIEERSTAVRYLRASTRTFHARSLWMMYHHGRETCIPNEFLIWLRLSRYLVTNVSTLPSGKILFLSVFSLFPLTFVPRTFPRFPFFFPNCSDSLRAVFAFVDIAGLAPIVEVLRYFLLEFPWSLVNWIFSRATYRKTRRAVRSWARGLYSVLFRGSRTCLRRVYTWQGSVILEEQYSARKRSRALALLPREFIRNFMAAWAKGRWETLLRACEFIRNVRGVRGKGGMGGWWKTPVADANRVFHAVRTRTLVLTG